MSEQHVDDIIPTRKSYTRRKHSRNTVRRSVQHVALVSIVDAKPQQGILLERVELVGLFHQFHECLGVQCCLLHA